MYRRRRIVALLLVLLLVGGLVWGVITLLGGEGEAAAEDDSAGAQVLLTSENGADEDEGDQPGSAPEPGEIVACSARDLAVAASADPASPAAGTQVTFQLVVRNEGQAPCLLDAGPGNLVVSTTSGQDAVWSSAHCAEGSNELLLDAEAHYTVPVRWGGHRSVDGCAAGQPAVQPGTYRASVSLAGTPVPLDEPVVLAVG